MSTSAGDRVVLLIQELIDGCETCETDEEFKENTRKIEEILNRECHIVQVIAKHLDDNLQPAYELVQSDDNICPHKDKVTDTACYKCPYNVCIENPEDGIFSFTVFKCFCAKEDDELNK